MFQNAGDNPLSDLFFYGTLRFQPLLDIVLGPSSVDICDATLDGYCVHAVKDQPFPILVPTPEGRAQGCVVAGLTEQDLERLNFYEGGFAYDLVPCSVETAQGQRQVQVYMAQADRWPVGDIWDFPAWQRQWGDVTLGAARDLMHRFGTISAGDAQHLLPFFRGRAWAQVLAKPPKPQTVRNTRTIADVELFEDDRPPYRGFFNLNTFSLRYPQFDGSRSKILPRECFISFDVALVLPYDPALDKVMLIEQLRFGPIQRGDPTPWVLEPVAGLVDAGETPLQAARRESVEEAGLDMRDMIEVPAGYASPGYSTEFYHSYIGVCDLSGRDQEYGGLDSENEDIRNHTMSFDHAMQLLDSGEISTAPLAMLLYALAVKRQRLREAS